MVLYPNQEKSKTKELKQLVSFRDNVPGKG